MGSITIRDYEYGHPKNEDYAYDVARQRKDDEMDEVPIPEVDRQRIEAMVAQYRHQIEHTYRLAYLQGQIESETKMRDELRRRVSA